MEYPRLSAGRRGALHGVPDARDRLAPAALVEVGDVERRPLVRQVHGLHRHPRGSVFLAQPLRLLDGELPQHAVHDFHGVEPGLREQALQLGVRNVVHAGRARGKPKPHRYLLRGPRRVGRPRRQDSTAARTPRFPGRDPSIPR